MACPPSLFAFAFPIFRRMVLGRWVIQWSFRTPRRRNGLVVIWRPPIRAATDCGQEFPGCHCESFRDVASSSEQTPPLNYVAAATHSIADWPSFQDLCGQGDCEVLPQGDIFPDMMLASQPRGNAISRTSNVDPMSRPLLAAGAQIVDPEEFRTCAKNGAAETPQSDSPYEVRALPERPIARVRTHE